MSDQTDVQSGDGSGSDTGDQSATSAQNQQAAAGSGSGSGTPPAGYVTEESYKGLQRAAERQKAKLEKELADARGKLEQSATELEEAKLAAAEKANLEKAQSDLNTNIANLQAERDKLTRQLNQQKIVLAEFPQLAPLAAYIPVADTDEKFKENAVGFEAALKIYVASQIKGTFEGSGPPIGSGNGSQSADALDKLWAEVYAVAGIPGKEKEYEEAYAKLQEALKTTS